MDTKSPKKAYILSGNTKKLQTKYFSSIQHLSGYCTHLNYPSFIDEKNDLITCSKHNTAINNCYYISEKKKIIGAKCVVGLAHNPQTSSLVTTLSSWKFGALSSRNLISGVTINNPYRLSLRLNGSYIDISSKLFNIASEIKYSRYILNLKDGWDDEDAIPIPKNIYLNTIKFLVNYSEYILDHFDTVIDKPEINPCKNGSVDLSWRTSKARMLINIDNSDLSEAFYYGDFYNNVNSIKGKVSFNEVNDYLATWMKNLV